MEAGLQFCEEQFLEVSQCGMLWAQTLLLSLLGRLVVLQLKREKRSGSACTRACSCWEIAWLVKVGGTLLGQVQQCDFMLHAVAKQALLHNEFCTGHCHPVCLPCQPLQLEQEGTRIPYLGAVPWFVLCSLVDTLFPASYMPAGSLWVCA